MYMVRYRAENERTITVVETIEEVCRIFERYALLSNTTIECIAHDFSKETLVQTISNGTVSLFDGREWVCDWDVIKYSFGQEVETDENMSKLTIPFEIAERTANKIWEGLKKEYEY